MLTDVILEEEFDKDGEPWYKARDLEHDLHLAAELGKTLLDRNHELEQALRQMYSTNHEQLQEIEYLSKQVELLRQMNDQHAKVYEQLDLAARDLEKGNHRLVQDNRLAQQRIHSLTETIEGLHTHMEDLQSQVDGLKTAQAERNKRDLAEQRRLGAQSVSCLRELYDLHDDRHQPEDGWLWSPFSKTRAPSPEEEHAALQSSVRSLQNQIAAERRRREAAERECELTAKENQGLEHRLDLLAGCRARQKELEEEVEQLRVLWRADCENRKPEQMLLPDTVFFTSEERSDPDPGAADEMAGRGIRRQRCNSDGLLRATSDLLRGHERTCIRRGEVVKQRGISLFNEVDAQYTALQVKYEELLQRCQLASTGQTHKSVQTSCSPAAITQARRRLSDPAAFPDMATALGDVQQPEYKALFQEIFTCIQKTKEDLRENRCKTRTEDSV
ncbi:LOW QUALITY PROTEIN: cerebellar degeneration-related protein 2 [Neosynchiropus ocellatus]